MNRYTQKTRGIIFQKTEVLRLQKCEVTQHSRCPASSQHPLPPTGQLEGHRIVDAVLCCALLSRLVVYNSKTPWTAALQTYWPMELSK